MTVYNERAKAKDEIVNSIRDLYTLKITLPLGNPNLKHVHTNQFLFTKFPEDVFELINLETIGNALQSSYSRFSGYKVNRWYVEGVRIRKDKNGGTMELTLNPFATTLSKYSDNVKDYQKTYTDAFTKQNNNNNSGKSASKSSKKTVKSTSTGIKLKNVKGFSKSDQKYIKKITQQALKKKNNPTNPLPIAYAIYEHYNKNHVYDGYKCMKKMRAHGFEYTWKKKGHNCGDGAATIAAMMVCAGLNAQILNRHGAYPHFCVRVKINGKYYYCDQAGAPGGHNKRTLGSKGNDNNVWHGIKGMNQVVDFKFC